jgi:hypothetical protein
VAAVCALPKQPPLVLARLFANSVAPAERHAFCSSIQTQLELLVPRRMIMDLLWALAVVLVVAWLAGFTVLHVTSGLLHLLLVFAVIAVVVRLVSGRRV